MLLNIVTNAIKYTPQGGTVALSLKQDDEAVTFSVRDSGIGIAAGRPAPHLRAVLAGRSGSLPHR